MQNSPNDSQSIVVLIGLPASGKSTLAKRYAERNYVIINQDTLKTRTACLKAARDALMQGHSVVIDRLNFNKEQREHWIKLANSLKIKHILANVLLIDKDKCIKRAKERENHPTINASNAEEVVNKIKSSLTYPELDEGFTEIWFSIDPDMLKG